MSAISDVRLTAAKFVVAGGFGVGKTTLIGSVSEVRPLTTEAAMTDRGLGTDDSSVVSDKSTTTVALDFGRITIDPSLILYLFGTPGQKRFAFMWEDLSVGALGAIVMVDTRRIEDSFVAMDWFEARDIPFVVAVNEFDGAERFEITEIREALRLPADVPVLTFDARVREQVKTVLLDLLALLITRARIS